MGNPPIPAIDGLEEVIANLRVDDGISIILVGSAARQLRDENSDIDLLLVGAQKPRPPRAFPGYHIQASSTTEFLRNLEDGEDFEAWCVRLGIPIHDSGGWQEIQNSAAAARWPKWQLKVSHGARRLFLAQTLFDMGDYDAATEELLYAAGHVARGLLLKRGIFPLSRPELAGQLRELGFPHLANLHESLRRGRPNLSLIRQAIHYTKKLLCFLDRDLYEGCGKEERLKKKRKEAARA